MEPGRADLTIKRNETFQRDIFWKDENLAAIILTGYTAKMQIRSHFGEDATLYHTLDSSLVNGSITITALEGKMALKIPKTITKDFEFSRAVYDLLLTAGDGTSMYLLEGNILVTQRSTQ